MKALLYKEFKLAMHPICYVFIIVFPLMILIPSYPPAVGFIYVLTTYPILFLGANKGQQSNDLLFSTLLPIRKRDIVLARIFTVIIMHIIFKLIMTALYPLALLINSSIPPSESESAVTFHMLGLDGYVSILGISLIGFAIADLIYFLVYYKNGKSIVLSTLLMIIGYVIYLAIFTIIIPNLPGCLWYEEFLCKSGIGYQFIVLGSALIIYVLLHIITHKIASKELEQVDF